MRIEDFGQDKAGSIRKAAGGYWAFIPNPLPPVVQPTWALANAVSEADRALSELSGVARTLPNPHLLIQPFMRREAVLSSRIEGTQASLSDLLYFEASDEAIRRTSDVVEVANYRHALEYGLSRLDDLPLSLRLLREIHAILLKGGGPSKTPGEFRRSQNWIGAPGCMLDDATFVPPPPDEMMGCLGQLEGFLHTKEAIPPLVRFAMAHYQFEAIHPFLDGNGRVGRLLIVLLMYCEKVLPTPMLYLSAYFERNRQEYYDRLLAVSQRGEWTEWLRFFLEGVREQARDAADRAERLMVLWKKYREKAQEGRNSTLAVQIVDGLFERPMTSVPMVAKQFGRSYQGAKLGVRQLVEHGILAPVEGLSSRALLYAANGIREVLEGSRAT